MRIEIDSVARVSCEDETLRRILFDKCAIPNPMFESAKKYSPWGNARVPQYLYFASHNGGNTVVVPRGFSFYEYEEFIDDDVEIIDRRVSCKTDFPDPILDLHVSQRYVQSQILEYADDPQGTFLVVMPTSRGKTITTLLTLAELKERALVLVHTDLILNAWIKDFNKTFGVPSQEVGIIKQDEWRIGDHLTVASIQTLIRRQKKWGKLWKEIGVVVVDECHISPCPTIVKILGSCPAKYRIGITATDTRKDGMHEVLYLLFGKPFVRQSVECSDTKSSLQIADAKVIQTDFYAEYGEDYNQFLDELMWDRQRNDLIVTNVMKEYGKGKVCLVVTNRRQHAHLLCNMLRDAGADTDLLLGGMKLKESRAIVQRYLSGKKGVIVATNKLISVGANIPPLERLFITIPYANEGEIIQLAGRIRRKHKDKEDAIIYIFQDVRIPRVNQIFRKYIYPAFQKMRIPTWENKYF